MKTCASPRGLIRRALMLLPCLAAPLSAQVPEVVPQFPHDQILDPGRLYFRQTGMGRITLIEYHNGDIFSYNVGGGSRRRWRFSDITDPSSLTLLDDTNSLSFRVTAGTHGTFKTGDYFSTRIRRVSPGVNEYDAPSWPDNTWHSIPNRPEGRSFTFDFFPFWTTFNWQQYNDQRGWGVLHRDRADIWSWDVEAQTGVMGYAYLLGNLMVLVSDEESDGVATLDMTPAFNGTGDPILLDRITHNDRGDPLGSYLPAIWKNYLVMAVRRQDPNRIDVIDISDPTDLRIANLIELPRVDSTRRWMGAAFYTQCQDDYCFTEATKFDPLGGVVRRFVKYEGRDTSGAERPPGSLSGAVNTTNYLMPLGNLLLTGGSAESGADAMAVWAHQAEPDTTGPTVSWHVPRPDQTDFPVNAPVSLVINETLESYTIINGETITLRPIVDGLPGSPVDCLAVFSFNDVLTLTPRQPLADDTTYEVVVTEGGIKDAVGNGIAGTSFRFSTGSTVGPPPNAGPTIESVVVPPGAVEPGGQVELSVVASDPEEDPIEYLFDFGDGTESGWQASPNVSHVYPVAGHYEIFVRVRDVIDGTPNPAPGDSERRIVTVFTAPGGPRPGHSGPLALDPDGTLWTVNPDNDSLAAVDPASGTTIAEIPLGGMVPGGGSIDPRAVAFDSEGQLWVACKDADAILVIDAASGVLVEGKDLGHGAHPIGLATGPDGDEIFATLEGRGASDPSNGQLLRFAAAGRAETGRLELGPMPRAIAVTGSGSRVLVTRFLSPESGGEVWDVASTPGGLTLTDTIRLPRDRGPDETSNGRGLPNQLGSIAISPDGRWAWYTAVKMNTHRGSLFFDGGANPSSGDMTPDIGQRAMVGRIDLSTNREPGVELGGGAATSRIDIDNSESPSAVEFSALGDYAFVTLQGNERVVVFDRIQMLAGGSKLGIAGIETGRAPQGLLLDPVRRRLFVKSFMSRQVEIVDLGEFIETGLAGTLAPVSVATVSSERLSPQVLRGKQIFYSATDGAADDLESPMSLETYISCATCHLDGAQDGRVWDFTQRGEGLRNTTDLRGRAGTGHGNVHWSANFDEIHDFELDIVNHFGGRGFLAEGDEPHPSLGAPNAGRSSDLDALAAYVSSLDEETLPASPHREPDGTLSAAARAGALHFQGLNCASCHLPDRDYTDSTLGQATLHDVGTLRTTSGSRLGETLPGIDTPTLLGLWNTPPYLHDGSAASLPEVFRASGGAVIPAESGALSNAAVTTPSEIESQLNGSSFGAAVRIEATGGSLTLAGIDGGSGGPGAVELRVLAPTGGSLELRVGGEVLPVAVPAQGGPYDWRAVRIDNVPLAAGDNTLVLESLDDRQVFLDAVTVSTIDILAAAEAHQIANALTPQAMDELLAYLLELDGRGAAGTFPTPGGFQEANGIVAFEAEHGELGASWTTGSDPSASNSRFIEIDGLTRVGSDPGPTPPEHLVTYDFEIDLAGDYSFWFRTWSDHFEDDSFWWRMDGGPWNLENDRAAIGEWYRSDPPEMDHLVAGPHRLELTYREDGLRLDKIVIQTDDSPSLAGGGGGPMESETGTPRFDYASWAEGRPWLASLESRDPSADPLGRGLANLIAYATDIDPAAEPGLRPLMVEGLSADGQTFSVLFRRVRKGAPGVNYGILFASEFDGPESWRRVVFDQFDNRLSIADPDPDGDGSAELVRAEVEAEGLVSGFVRLEIGSTTIVAPDVPSGLQASAASAEAIEVSFIDESANEEEYEVRFRTPGGAWSSVFAAAVAGSGSVGSARIEALEPDTAYEVEIRALHSGYGASAWASLGTVTTAAFVAEPAQLVPGTVTRGLVGAPAPSAPSPLLVFVAASESAGTLSGVDYGGQAMTRAAVRVNGINEVSVWYLDGAGIAAATGTDFTPSWSGTEEGEGYSSFFLRGVDQSSPVGTAVGLDDPYPTGNQTLSLPALAVGDGDYAVLAAVRGNTGTFTLGGGFTELDDFGISSGSMAFGGGAIAADGVVTASVTHSNANNRLAAVALVFRGER